MLKQRGSGSARGEHTYRISSAGLDVFPRLADVQDPSPYTLGTERASTGIPALDDILGEGYWPGSATLIAGPSGAGKTLMGLHFLFAGAAAGEHGVLATLQENRVQLERIVGGFGWSLDTPGVADEPLTGRHVPRRVGRRGSRGHRARAGPAGRDRQPRRSDVLLTDELRFREYMYSLLQRSRQGVSCLMAFELPELFRTTRASEPGMSHLADNVVLLQHVLDAEISEAWLSSRREPASTTPGSASSG